jgi:hypothetical protein
VKLQWGSLLADDEGRFDRDKIKTFVAVFLALVGGVSLVVCSVLDGITRIGLDFDNGTLALMAGICVAPLTGGTITTALANRAERKEVAAVLAGEKPGRRASDANPVIEGDVT